MQVSHGKEHVKEQTRAFLKSAYREFYFGRGSTIEFPEALGSREFGFMPFGGGMIRHLSFKDSGAALAEIVRQSPSSVYCSNATYDFPTLPIEEKGWMGAELIFDIDATDIPTSCKRDHDLWYCENCHSSGKLPRLPECPKCGGSTNEYHGTCEVCLAAAKEHTTRVVEFLTEDFGVPRELVKAYFSGNRGYHLHVLDDRFSRLSPTARAEVAGYIRGESLPAGQTIAAALRRRRADAGPEGEGWARRITTYVEARRSGHSGTLQKLVSEAITSERAFIDSSVTTDIHRVFRLAGTLHGATGMSKSHVSELESFDPATEAIALPGRSVKVNVSFYPRFDIGRRSFGPFKSETAELPTFAAIQILTRGLGEVSLGA